MKATRLAIVLLLTLVLVLTMGQSALAARGSEGPGGDVFGTNPDAVGTIVKGTVTLYYEKVQGNPGDCFLGITANMYVFMQLKKAGEKTWMFFSGHLPYSEKNGVWDGFCFEDTAAQIDFVKSVIATDVVPHFFGAVLPHELKKVNKIVETEADAFPLFTMMDVQIAVDEGTP